MCMSASCAGVTPRMRDCRNYVISASVCRNCIRSRIFGSRHLAKITVFRQSPSCRNHGITAKNGSGGIEKSHSCKWAKWIQWHALPHIQQSTQQRNKGYYPNLHGWDFSIPPLPKKWWWWYWEVPSMQIRIITFIPLLSTLLDVR